MALPKFDIEYTTRFEGGKQVPPRASEVTVNLDGRPLLLIDPEDRRQARLLLSAFCRQAEFSIGTIRGTDHMQAALRQLAEPPKPDRWTNGDVIQAVTTNLVWSRTNGLWYPSSETGNRVTATDAEFDAWLEGGRDLRILREQKAGVNP